HGHDHGHDQHSHAPHTRQSFHDDHVDHAHDHHDHGEHEHERDHHDDDDHDHDHHDHPAPHAKAHQDLNLRGAYLHVIADALTSVTAIVALLCGMTLGWIWMDPLMGIIGSVVIAVWAYGLIRDSAKTLLDAEDNFPLRDRIQERFQTDPELEIADLHLWRVGPSSHACIISLITHHPEGADHYKTLLRDIEGLDHVTVEVNHCRACP
ncbi:MAG: cation transporter, partial [Magnetococcales bacterium]|nr:cation transporter [Magnetococcales bacterium]